MGVGVFTILFVTRTSERAVTNPPVINRIRNPVNKRIILRRFLRDIM
jgi:hypothetical protein